MKKIGVIAAVLAGVIIIGVGVWFALGNLGGEGTSRAEFEEALLKETPIFETLKAKFPEDYKGLLDELMTQLAAKKSPQELSDSAASMTAGIRKKYASNVVAAPDDELKRIIKLSRDFHKTILDNEGHLNCNRLGIRGIGGIATLAPKYKDAIAQQGVAYFDAVAMALKTPATREKPSPNDWSILTRTMIDNGASQDDITALGGQNAEDPRFCNALIAFMDTLLTLPGDPGERLRADLVKNISAN